MQYINYDALIKNAQFFRSKLSKSKLCAVVKCDAYGHGIERVASCLHDIIDCFAVNDVLEALKIEKYGKDILILMPQDKRATKIAIEHQFVLTIDSFDTLKTITKFNKDSVRAHIKIDSGMSRLGFKLEELPTLIKMLKGSSIHVEGIFSHFFAQNKLFCDEQLNYFAKCSKIVSRKFGNITKHIANTSGVLLDDKYHLDMVRIGLGLFGYGSCQLQSVKTVTAKVIAKKRLPKGAIVGYDAKHLCQKPTDIAIVDIGYNNGYIRSLCGATMQIGNNFVKVIGNVCMSMCAIDVTGIPVEIGDEVIVLGENVNPSNDNVIIYQLLCNLR